MHNLLVSKECTRCEEVTDHELNTLSLETECLSCGTTEQVTDQYVQDLLESDDYN